MTNSCPVCKKTFQTVTESVAVEQPSDEKRGKGRKRKAKVVKVRNKVQKVSYEHTMPVNVMEPWEFEEDDDDDELDEFDDMDDFFGMNEHPDIFSGYRRQSLTERLLSAVYGAINISSSIAMRPYYHHSNRNEIIDLRNVANQDEIVTIMSDDDNNNNDAADTQSRRRRQRRGLSLFETAATRARGRQARAQPEPEFLDLDGEAGSNDWTFQTTLTADRSPLSSSTLPRSRGEQAMLSLTIGTRRGLRSHGDNVNSEPSNPTERQQHEVVELTDSSEDDDRSASTTAAVASSTHSATTISSSVATVPSSSSILADNHGRLQPANVSSSSGSSHQRRRRRGAILVTDSHRNEWLQQQQQQQQENATLPSSQSRGMSRVIHSNPTRQSDDHLSDEEVTNSSGGMSMVCIHANEDSESSENEPSSAHTLRRTSRRQRLRKLSRNASGADDRSVVNTSDTVQSSTSVSNTIATSRNKSKTRIN